MLSTPVHQPKLTTATTQLLACIQTLVRSMNGTSDLSFESRYLSSHTLPHHWGIDFGGRDLIYTTRSLPENSSQAKYKTKMVQGIACSKKHASHAECNFLADISVRYLADPHMADSRKEVRRVEWTQLPPDIISLVNPNRSLRSSCAKHTDAIAWAEAGHLNKILCRDMSSSGLSLPGSMVISPKCYDMYVHSLPPFGKDLVEAVSALRFLAHITFRMSA